MPPKKVNNKNPKQELNEQELDEQPFEFSNDPEHFDLINRKIRALRKKLRKISESEEKSKEGKKLNQDQINSINSKPQLVQNLREIEEIKKSVSTLDLTKELRLVSYLYICINYYHSFKVKDLFIISFITNFIDMT
jgi:hypothetical protein